MVIIDKCRRPHNHNDQQCDCQRDRKHGMRHMHRSQTDRDAGKGGVVAEPTAMTTVCRIAINDNMPYFRRSQFQMTSNF